MLFASEVSPLLLNSFVDECGDVKHSSDVWDDYDCQLDIPLHRFIIYHTPSSTLHYEAIDGKAEDAYSSVSA